MSTFDPLDEILVQLLHNTSQTSLTTTLQALTPTDWATLIAKAQAHDLASALYHQLRTAALLPLLPASISQQLQREYHRVVANNTLQYQELGKILTTLHTHQIEAIVLKGTHLVAISNNLGLRSCGDIDLLLRPDQLLVANQALEAIGYTRERALEKVTATVNHLPALRNGKATVELHDTIATADAPFRIVYDDLFGHSQPFTVRGVTGMGFCPEDLLLHLCIHAAYQHSFDHGLRSIYDILGVVRAHPTLDWAKFVRSTQAWQAGKPAYLTLCLSHALLGVKIPATVLAQLAPKHFDATLLAIAKQQLFYAAQPQPFVTHGLIQAWNAKGVQDKGLAFWRRLFLPREKLAETYALSVNSYWLYFYYLVRLRYLLLQHGDTLWQLWRGNEGVVNRFERERILHHWLSS